MAPATNTISARPNKTIAIQAMIAAVYLPARRFTRP
jgi:hypothetical protein